MEGSVRGRGHKYRVLSRSELFNNSSNRVSLFERVSQFQSAILISKQDFCKLSITFRQNEVLHYRRCCPPWVRTSPLTSLMREKWVLTLIFSLALPPSVGPLSFLFPFAFVADHPFPETLAAPSEATPGEAIAPVEKRDIGCAQQGTPSKPAICARPNCPSGYRSVFWDFGCPDGSWKCCI